MKKINFVLILWALIAVSGRCYGQSVFENIEYFPNDGEDEIESSLNLSTDLQGMAQRFTPSGSSLEETKYKSRHLLNLLGKDKIKTSFWAKMNREQRLTDHANLKLHYNINDEKIEMQNYYNRMGNLRSNDQLIAKAWEKSPTGRRDGRYWDELSDGEKEVMRSRYIRHHNPKVFEENYSPGLVIPESEYAMAWEIRNFGMSGVPTWKQLRDFQTKNKFRKCYYYHKLAKLTPMFDVSDDELSEAWEIANLGGSEFVSWSDISDSKTREKFRASYLDMLYRNAGTIAGPRTGQNKMVAMANFHPGPK